MSKSQYTLGIVKIPFGDTYKLEWRYSDEYDLKTIKHKASSFSFAASIDDIFSYKENSFYKYIDPFWDFIYIDNTDSIKSDYEIVLAWHLNLKSKNDIS